MIKRAILLTAIACELAWTQPADDSRPAASNVMNAQYPRIHSDLRATFRLNAPDTYKAQVSMGTEEPDPFLTAIGAFRKMLDQSGVRYTYFVSPGTAHEWQTRRRDLNDFAPRLFR